MRIKYENLSDKINYRAVKIHLDMLGMALAPQIKKSCLYYKVCQNAAQECKVENQTYEFRPSCFVPKKTMNLLSDFHRF